jgi:hypothetical protein
MMGQGKKLQPVKGKVNGMRGTASSPSTSSKAVEGADDLKVNVLAFGARWVPGKPGEEPQKQIPALLGRTILRVT